MNDYSTAPAARDAGSPPSAADRARPRSRWAARVGWGVVALCVAAFLARLGVWQLSRAHEKTALVEQVAQRGAMPPLDAAAVMRDPSTAVGQAQRRIVLTGQWLPDRTLWLMNRTMDEFNGFVVVTPLRLPDGQVVLVQRGFVAGEPGNTLKPPRLATPAGEVRVEGHVDHWPAHRLELGQAASGPVRQNLARGAWSAEAGMAPWPVMVVEDEGPANAGDGLVRHWAQPVGSAMTNYGYAVQWFAMSLTVVGLYAWLQFFRRPTPADPPSADPSAGA